MQKSAATDRKFTVCVDSFSKAEEIARLKYDRGIGIHNDRATGGQGLMAAVTVIVEISST